MNKKNYWLNPLGIKSGDFVRCWFKNGTGTTYGAVYKVDRFEEPKYEGDIKRYVKFVDDLGRLNGLAAGWFTLATETEIVLYGANAKGETYVDGTQTKELHAHTCKASSRKRT